MAKFQMSKLRQLHRELTGILADWDDAKAAEAAAAGEGTATDNPPEFSGKPAAMDRAPSLDTRTGRKLTHVPHTRAVAALEAAIPAVTRLRGKY
jgi:hypothetical protein